MKVLIFLPKNRVENAVASSSKRLGLHVNVASLFHGRASELPGT